MSNTEEARDTAARIIAAQSRKVLRDQFAMAALAVVEVDQQANDARGAAAIARAAYMIADAMMREREK